MIAQFVSSLLPSPRASLENPRFSLNDAAAYDMLAGNKSESGVSVNWSSALSLAPVWQAVSIISGDVATSTPHVLSRDKNGDRVVAIDHPGDYLISEQPNIEMSAFELWRRFMVHALLWQNAYLYIERLGGVGRPVGIYNLLPDRTFPARDENGTLYYKTEVGGKMTPLKRDDVIHVKGLSVENGVGYDLVCAARDSWGLALAAEGFGSKFFANGAQAGGVLEVPPGTTPDVADKLAAGMQKKYTGKDNWFRVMVLRDGAKFHETTINAQESQLTELREHQVRDTARFFNLPPSKLGLSDSVSYNSSEQSQIQYITGCLTHWFAAIRGEVQGKLLTETERKARSHFVEFNTSKLIERDLKTQVDILAIERQNEIINAAEWRRKRDLPPRTDPAANEYVNPNTKSAPPASAPKTPAEPPAKNRISNAIRMVCEDAINRITRRVTAHVRSAAKNPGKLVAWIDSKGHEHRDVFHQLAMPAATLVAEATGDQGDDICYSWGGRFFASIVPQLEAAINPPHLASDLEQNVESVCRQFEATICSDLLTNYEGSKTNAN